MNWLTEPIAGSGAVVFGGILLASVINAIISLWKHISPSKKL